MTTVTCDSCNGTGILPGSRRQTCHLCYGDGTLISYQAEAYTVICDACDGAGTKEVSCYFCNGSGTYTKTTTCNSCSGTGQYWAPRLREYRTCQPCNGADTVDIVPLIAIAAMDQCQGRREAVLCSFKGGYRAIYIVGRMRRDHPPGRFAACDSVLCCLRYG
jgi:DnaJ-class molecular chaperone